MTAMKWLGGIAAGLAMIVIAGLLLSLPSESKVTARLPSARQKVEARLDQLDQAGVQAIDKNLQRIRTFLWERRAGAKPFAEATFSWTAKFYMVKGGLTGDDGAGFREWLQEKFDETLFRNSDLQAVVDSAVQGFLQDCSGQENEALVQIRLDLADNELFEIGQVQVRNEDHFREEFQRLSEQVLPKVADDLKIGIAGQLTSFVGSEAAAMTLGRSLAGRIGSFGGVFGTIARSGLARFGMYATVGAFAWVGVEYLYDWIVSVVSGHNPAKELTAQVEQALSRVEEQIIEGNPRALADYNRLRQQESENPQPENQARCRQEADRIEQSGALGLRFQMQRIQELQSRIRREALVKLVETPEQP